jgi:hypothetical protein
MNFVAAILYAVSSSALLAVLLAFLRGGLNPSSAGISLAFGLLVAAVTLWRRRNEVLPSRRPGPWEWVAIVAFVLVTARMFLWVVFYDRDNVKVISPNNLGDISLHLTYIQQLASGAAFWPDNPIYTGGKLTYPIGVDLFNSLLTLLGVDVFRGLICTGLIGSALTGIALWRWGRGFALFGFLANGGLFGFAMFANFQPASLYPGDILAALTSLELKDFQGPYAWKSFALALLATQRGLLFAFPAGLALLCSWRTRWFPQDSDGWKLSRPGELLLYASMPLFHLHTFLFFSLLLAAWFVAHAPARRELATLVGAAFVPATALVLLVTGMLKGSSVLGFKAGWMWDDDAFLMWCTEHFGETTRAYAAALFWPMNFGVLPIFVLLLCIILWRTKRFVLPVKILFPALAFFTLGGVLEFTSVGPLVPSRELVIYYSYVTALLFLVTALLVLLVLLGRTERADFGDVVVFPALGAFLLCCFVKFAPWEWDNTKIMVWSYLAILPFLWSHLISRWPRWGRALACFALFFSGFVSTLGGIDATHKGHEFASREELDNVAMAVRTIPVSERFVGAPTYNHPLLLCGRKMAMGYPGHVSSHGLAWEAPLGTINRLMRGADNWRELAAQLNCRYLFWGRYEQNEYPDSTEPWRETVKLVALGDWGEIYDLQTPRPQDNEPR